jgi:hypothetical protein
MGVTSGCLASWEEENRDGTLMIPSGAKAFDSAVTDCSYRVYLPQIKTITSRPGLKNPCAIHYLNESFNFRYSHQTWI